MKHVIILIFCLTISAQCSAIDFAGSGVLRVAGNGVLRLAGIYTGPEPLTGWINPTMTALNLPAPAVVTSYNDDADAYKVFDHATGTGPTIGGGEVGWVKLDFGAGNAQTCNVLYLYNSINSHGVNGWEFYGSNDDSAWTLLGTGTAHYQNLKQELDITNSTAYRYYRFNWTSWYDVTMMYIYEIMLYNIDPRPDFGYMNATMTANNAPSPNVVSDSGSHAQAYYAFDHNTGSNAGLDSTNGWIKYYFGYGNLKIINHVYLKNMELFGIKTWTIAGSNDNTNWTTLGTGVAADNETRQSLPITTTQAYMYYRLSWTDSYAETGMDAYIYEVELWRE